MTNNDIQISVCIVTYNQEKYIAECLDSIVTQKTNFKFEIIVGDDCSTDNTRSIIQEYVEKYPDLIIPVFHKKNVGVVENIKQVYEVAKGKYIAHLDGDDLALPEKLQKQFDVMEKNPQAIICSHNMLEILNNRIIEKSHWDHPKGEYEILDLIKNLPFFSHSSKLFRVIDKDGLFNILKYSDTLDIEIHLYQITMGSIFHLEENLGCYRKNVGVSAVKKNKMNHAMIERIMMVYENLMITKPMYKADIQKAYALYLLGTAASFAVVESNNNKMKEFTIKSVKQKLFSKKQLFMLVLAICPTVGIPVLKTRHILRSRLTGE